MVSEKVNFFYNFMEYDVELKKKKLAILKKKKSVSIANILRSHELQKKEMLSS